MRVKFEIEDRWEPIKVGEEEFEVLVTLPTYDEQLNDYGYSVAAMYGTDPQAHGEAIHKRILATIKGWRGLVDMEDKQIPFNEDNLRSLLVAYPEVFTQISRLASQRFNRRGEEKKSKNDDPTTGKSQDERKSAQKS